MINTITVFETNFGSIHVPSNILLGITYEDVPMGEDEHMSSQPIGLPANPAFWAYIDKESTLLEDKHWGV